MSASSVVSNRRAILIGLDGPELTEREKRLIEAAPPLGFCLFRRNIVDPIQLRGLTASLREVSRDDTVLILIDQEGGRVQRLGPPHWPDDPSPQRFGDRAASRPRAAEKALRLVARAVAAELRDLAINVNAWPGLDLCFPGASNVVGDRSFGADPDLVARLGRIVCAEHMSAGILPVIKHMPGHGRAAADSHTHLPRVDIKRSELELNDMAPFRALSDMPVGMTAHVVYTRIDADRPATLSATIISELIRGSIGFGGLLLSDDLTMGAISGSPGERVAAGIAAGCDAVLYCNAAPDRMAEALTGAPALSDRAQQRLERAREHLVVPAPACLPRWRHMAEDLLSGADGA